MAALSALVEAAPDAVPEDDVRRATSPRRTRDRRGSGHRADAHRPRAPLAPARDPVDVGPRWLGPRSARGRRPREAATAMARGRPGPPPPGAREPRRQRPAARRRRRRVEVRESDGELAVSDDGRASPPELDPFARGRFGTVRSTGSASVVRAVAEAHGGSLELESEPGRRGSTFRLVLPSAGGGR